MNRSLDPRSDSRTTLRARAAALPTSEPATGTSVRRILSKELFDAGAVVEIQHQGEIYRLRHTRKGKLILTK